MVKNRQSKKVKTSFYISLFVALLIVTPFFIMNQEKLSLNSITRKDLGYSYVQLGDGMTHYQLTGPQDGPVVILIHGFSVPLHDWDFQVDALVQAGYQVLRYDHYGRGFSDRPGTDYDRDLYSRQLNELTKKLNLNRPYTLVGHSYGAAVAAEFANRNKDRVDKVVLLTPVLNPAESNSAIPLAKIPLFGSWFMRVAGIPIIEGRGVGLYDEAIADKNRIPQYQDEFSRQFAYHGTSAAFTSLFRTGAFGDYTCAYDALQASDIPVMMVYGGRDNSVSTDHFNIIKDIFIGHRVEYFPEGLHSLNLQMPGEFNRLLLDFLGE